MPRPRKPACRCTRFCCCCVAQTGAGLDLDGGGGLPREVIRSARLGTPSQVVSLLEGELVRWAYPPCVLRPATSGVPSGFAHCASAIGPWQSAATSFDAYIVSIAAFTSAFAAKSVQQPGPPER